MLNKKTNNYFYLYLFFLSFTIGFGTFKILILLLIVGFPFFLIQNRPSILFPSPGGWFLFFLIFVFLVKYAVSHISFNNSLSSFEDYYFEMLFVLCSCVFILPYCFNDAENSLRLIKYLLLGAFFWALISIVVTILFSTPPYYGNIVDLRAFARGLIQFGNTPGIANLLSFFPILFFASLIHSKVNQSIWHWIFTGSLLTATFLGAVLIEQRSFFVITFIVLPLLVGFFLIGLGRLKVGLWVLASLTIYPALLIVNHKFNFIDREINADIFLDGRFQLMLSWFHQLLTNPFERPVLGPGPFESLQHFHNFFADIHRISGFWALFSAVLLVLFIFVRLIYLTYLNRKIGFYLLTIAVPVFLIMVSSVVPEGEKQPLLALLLTGVLCEQYLSTSLNKSRTHLYGG